MSSQQEDDVASTEAFLYLGSVICSFGIAIWIRYLANRNKTHVCKKYEVWKILEKMPLRLSVLVTILVAVTAAIVGGLLNYASGGWDPLRLEMGDTFSRALYSALPSGLLCGILTGSPIIFTTTTVFTFTGILEGRGCYESMGLATFSLSANSSLDSSLDCLNSTQTRGIFDWFLGSPDPSWTQQTKWSHDMIGLSLRGLMWTIPVGLPIRAYGYSSLVSFSGLAMGIAYQAGYSLFVPFPLCLIGLTPGMAMGEFYMGAWLFFVFTVCFLGSNQPFPTADAIVITNVSTSPATIKLAPTIVELYMEENDKQSLKARALDTDTDTDEPLVVACVVGEPVSPTTTPTANTPKYGRCGRPLHGSRAMQLCWAGHFFSRIYIILAAVFVVCMWVTYSSDAVADTAADENTDNNSWLFGWDTWYVWFLVYFVFLYAYRVRSRRGGRVCCCRRNFSSQWQI